MSEKQITRKEFILLLGGLLLLVGAKSIPSKLIQKVVPKTPTNNRGGYGTDVYGG
jgi:hypothetical protein